MIPSLTAFFFNNAVRNLWHFIALQPKSNGIQEDGCSDRNYSTEMPEFQTHYVSQFYRLKKWYTISSVRPALYNIESDRGKSEVESLLSISSIPETEKKQAENTLVTKSNFSSWKLPDVLSDPRLNYVTVYVIGCGIIGLLTAYELAIRGFHVVVLESRPTFGTQCSASSLGILDAHDEIHNDEDISFLNIIKGWWYWSDLRAYLMSFSVFLKLKSLFVRFERCYWMSEDDDPFFERLKWNNDDVNQEYHLGRTASNEITTDIYSEVTNEEIKNVNQTHKSYNECRVAQRNFQCHIALLSSIKDPHFVRWRLNQLSKSSKHQLQALCQRVKNFWLTTDGIVEIIGTKLSGCYSAEGSKSEKTAQRNKHVEKERTNRFTAHLADSSYSDRISDISFEKNRSEMHKFAEWSIQRLQNIIQNECLNCEMIINCSGIHLATTKPGLDELKNKGDHMCGIKLQETEESRSSKNESRNRRNELVVSGEECLKRLPYLRESPLPIKGGRLIDGVGSVDVTSLMTSLKKICEEKYGVQFAYETEVGGFLQFQHNGATTVAGLRTSNGSIPVAPILSPVQKNTPGTYITHSPIILANGAWTPRLAAELGVYVPLYPVKGTTLIFDTKKNLAFSSFSESSSSFNNSIPPVCQYSQPSNPEPTQCNGSIGKPLVNTLNAAGSFNPIYRDRIVSVNPIYRDRVVSVNHSKQSLRISAFYELNRWLVVPSNRMKNGLFERALLLYPGLFLTGGRCAVVSGLRPVSFDYKPIVGQLPQTTNVFINSGGGSNGYSTAAGSAVLIAEIIKAQVLKSIEQHSRESIAYRQGRKNTSYTSYNKSKLLQSKDSEYTSPILSTLSHRFDHTVISPLHRAHYSPLFCRWCLWAWKNQKN